MRNAVWSRARVIDELRRLDRSGQSTLWGNLMHAGRADLVRAAATHAGGLRRARARAHLRAPERRRRRARWTRARIVVAIQDRIRKQQTLASSKAPQSLVAAARWHFGSWDAALAAAGVDAQAVRLQRAPYRKSEVIALLRRLARDGAVIRASTLKRLIKIDAVRKLFGSVEQAVRAAGLEYGPHPNRKWTRQRVLEELRARARLGERTLTRRLHRAVRLHFGGVRAAREAAGLPVLLRAAWTRESLVAELRRRARRGDSGSTLWTPCKRLFGSIAAARRIAGVPATQRPRGMASWSKRELLVELRRRVRERRQLGRGLVAGLRREFGTLAAARARAGVLLRGARDGATRKRPTSGEAWRRWSRAQVLTKLRAWGAGGGRLGPELQLACKLHFGSVARARAAANVAAPAAWTPARIRQALGERGFDASDPAFVAACIEHFGSVTAARAARSRPQRTWSKTSVIAELQARSRRGLRGVGALLRAPAVRLFGSTQAALDAAARAAHGGA